MAGGNSAQKRERNRCAAIVRDRRAMVERKLITGGYGIEREKKIVRRVIAMLQEIERSILDVPEATTQEIIQYAGDFSVEEMERAQSIIEEQERNPFEG